MKTYTIAVTEINKGTVEIEAPDDASDDTLEELAEQAYESGKAKWNNTEVNYSPCTQ
jgi:hypothetical protein